MSFAPLSTSPLAFLAQLSPIHCQEPLTHILATAATASTATCTGWELSKHLEHKSVSKLPPPPLQPPEFWELKSQKALTSYLLSWLLLEYKKKCPRIGSKNLPGTTKPSKRFPRESPKRLFDESGLSQLLVGLYLLSKLACGET